MKKKVTVFITALALVVGIQLLFVSAATKPMLQAYLDWAYGDEGISLVGIIPALGDNEPIPRSWQLSQWTGIVTYPNKEQSIISNYDVFNVKPKDSDPKFDKENGFGLVVKSQDSLGTLFDAFTKGNNNGISEKQWSYYRDSFVLNADDPSFKKGHPFYYTIWDQYSFLRTAGIIQRMGYTFDRTQKVSDDERQALFTASPWPSLSYVQSEQGFVLNYKAYGYSTRNLRLIATAKGAFPNLTSVMSLNDGKLIQTDKNVASGGVSVTNIDELRDKFGNDIDVILEDGYGRTAIKTINLGNMLDMDYTPDGLGLSVDNKLSVNFHYTGDSFTTADYVNDRGLPMVASVMIEGPDGQNQTLQGLFTSVPDEMVDGLNYSFVFDQPIDIPDQAGTYTITANVTINNPNHQDRALEYPAIAYKNNTITASWVKHNTDLVADSIQVSPDDINVNGSSKIIAHVENVGDIDKTNVLIRFTDNGKVIQEFNHDLPANEVTTVGPFVWTGETEGNHNIMVDVDPDETTGDMDYSNNTALGTCLVKGVIDPVDTSINCNNSTVSKTWSVTYPTITGYKKDSKGRKRKIWDYKNVSYQEKLHISAAIDTKQGIPTQPNDHTDAGRESRGSWEIIPWSQTHNKNPNEVTRAGYGVEFKVNTEYTTDWETKVPVGYEGTAKKIGGTYIGPDQVFVWIWDTKGKYVGKVQLEKTGGADSFATWELPATKYETTTGPKASFYERKFYTDPDVPDGEYTFTIVTQYAGKYKMTACTTKKMTIFGSMYDDSQAVRDTSN